MTRRHSVILADELGLFREGLAAICDSSERFRVVGLCGDGLEALRLTQTLSPHLLVLDLSLPRLFTLEIVRKLRSAGSTTKVVLIGMRSDRKTVLEALRAGANAYVLKAGPACHLLDAFQQVLDGGVYVSPLLEMSKVFAQDNDSNEDPLELLSAREFQVFSLLVDGTRAKEIAARLDLSPKTIDTYRASLMRKLDIHDVAGLVKFALLRNLTSVV